MGKTTSASDLGLMMTPTSGSRTTLPADLFPCASKLVTSSTLGDLADPTRVSAPSAVVMALATTPGLSTMPTAGSPLTLCADARTEKLWHLTLKQHLIGNLDATNYQLLPNFV